MSLEKQAAPSRHRLIVSPKTVFADLRFVFFLTLILENYSQQ